MINHTQSRHSAEELDAIRNAIRAPMLRQFHRQRIDLQTRSVSIMLDNVRSLLWEIGDLMKHAGSSSEIDRVDFRTLLEVLRSTEVNLDAAAGRLASELDMVSMD